jgi:hypothetical protein
MGSKSRKKWIVAAPTEIVPTDRRKIVAQHLDQAKKSALCGAKLES